MSDLLGFSLQDGVAVLRFDDGKANALSDAALNALEQGLARAEKEADAVLLLGRPGRFSAGFDLSVMTQGPEAARELVTHGARLALGIVQSPLPVVAGCTGHALAMGAILLLAADLRIGARGPFKLGLNEVAIRMTLPGFAVELARERLSRRHLGRATVHAEIYAPEDAVDAGFLDRVVDDGELESVAQAEAAALGQLPRRAFAETKRAIRAEALERVERALAEMASWGG